MVCREVHGVHPHNIIIVRWLLITVITDHLMVTPSCDPSLLQLTIHSVVPQRLPLTQLPALKEVFVEFLLSQTCNDCQQHEEQDKTSCHSKQTEPSLVWILVL